MRTILRLSFLGFELGGFGGGGVWGLNGKLNFGGGGNFGGGVG